MAVQKQLLRFARLSGICLSLPEAVREDCNGHSTFLVSKKTFAYYLDNHHGDGISGLCCKALPGDNQSLRNPRKTAAEQSAPLPRASVPLPASGRAAASFALLIRSSPERFYMPACVGPKGWVGLRLDGAEPDWEEVHELIKLSYLRTAPKRLSALLSES